MKKELIKMILIRAGMNDPRGRVSEKAKKKRTDQELSPCMLLGVVWSIKKAVLVWN